MVLDRLNGSKVYGPEFCKWSTYKESTENRSNTVWAGGMRVQEIAKLTNQPESRVYSRLRRGWSFEEVMQPAIKHGYTKNGTPLNANLATRLKCGANP